MKKILVHFEEHQPLVIGLEDSETANSFHSLLAKNLAQSQPIWRDPLKYDLKYFQELCVQIKNKLGWPWQLEQFDLAKAVTLHKDLENYLEKDKSFRNIPGDQQMLLHEAHYCIHNILHMDASMPRGAFLQFEWFNDDHVQLPEDANFVKHPSYGDIELQNPYVGHPPQQCWQENDYKNIDRTCAFHDIIKPGIKINLVKESSSVDMNAYEKWWKTNCKDFVDKVGWSQILKYTGFPIIGKVKNLDHLSTIEGDKSLIFKSVELK